MVPIFSIDFIHLIIVTFWGASDNFTQLLRSQAALFTPPGNSWPVLERCRKNKLTGLRDYPNSMLPHTKNLYLIYLYLTFLVVSPEALYERV